MKKLKKQKQKNLKKINPPSSNVNVILNFLWKLTSSFQDLLGSRNKFGMTLLFLFIFTLPFQLGKFFFHDFSFISGVRIDYLAPVLFLTDIIATIIIILNINRLIGLFKNKLFWIFIGLGILNIVFALTPQIAIYKLTKLIEWICLLYIFKRTIIDPRYVLIAFLSSGCIELLLTIFQFINKHSIQGIFYWFGERSLSLSTSDVAKASLQGVEILRPYGTFSHPNSMAGFYLLLYFFVLTFPPFKKYGSRFAILFVSAVLIFLSFSKIAIIIFILLNSAYVISQRKEIGCYYCISARIFGLSILGYIVFMANGDPLSLSKRWELFQNAWTIFTQHPLGIGLGNYLYAQAQFPIKYSFFFLQPVHNIFLLMLTETGIIFCGYIFYVIWSTVKEFVYKLWFIFPFLVVILTGLFDHYWLTLQQNFLLMAVVFGLILSHSTSRLKKP